MKQADIDEAAEFIKAHKGGYLGVGPGWYIPIYHALKAMDRLVGPEGYNIGQIKEKFGELRLYVSVNYDVLEQQDEERGAPSVFGDVERRGRLIQELAAGAESASHYLCEECGAQTLNGARPITWAWVRTLCDDCTNKQQEEEEE